MRRLTLGSVPGGGGPGRVGFVSRGSVFGIANGSWHGGWQPDIRLAAGPLAWERFHPGAGAGMAARLMTIRVATWHVITSYSIHYTKLYE